MRRRRPRPGLGHGFGPWMLLAEALLLISLIAGAVSAGSLPESIQREVEQSLSLPEGNLAGGDELLAAALRRNLVQSAVPAWLLGLSLAGFPLALGILAWRGFQVGFAAGFLWDWAGGTQRVALLALVPHNLLALPALSVLAVALARLSSRVVLGLWRGRPIPRAGLLADSLAAGGATVALVGASYIEAYVTPRIVGLAFQLLG